MLVTLVAVIEALKFELNYQGANKGVPDVK
jgi:hypothetical protein